MKESYISENLGVGKMKILKCVLRESDWRIRCWIRLACVGIIGGSCKYENETSGSIMQKMRNFFSCRQPVVAE
jgi:hypothetical protein